MFDTEEAPPVPVWQRVALRVRSFLSSRKGAYTRVFVGTGIDGRLVLEDLAKFCRAHESTFHTDAALSDRLDGRREVWLRIQQHLNLSDKQVWALYESPQLRKGLDDVS